MESRARDTNGRGVFGWTAAMSLVLLMALFCGRAWGVQSYTPLREYMAGVGPEFILGTVGDSWTCNQSQDGIAVTWGSDLVGSIASYNKNLIWADKSTSNGSGWTNWLGYRLKTHRYFSESVGGAALASNTATFTFKSDSSICGWVDEVGAKSPALAIGYGGINNMMTYATLNSWAVTKTMLMGFAQKLVADIKPPARIIMMTLQPCSLDPMRYKKAGTAGWTSLTWTQIGEKALEIQALQGKYNAYLLDTLKKDLKASGYDTSRVFVWDLAPNLLQGHTWTPGASSSLYPLTLGNGTTGLPSATQADSIKWAALRFARREIDQDSIHVTRMGQRQIADSMATQVFGVNFTTWTPGENKTLYVSMQSGHNWNNRLVATERATPLATLQCAAWRAWPGDSIAVIGTGNQAIINSSTGIAVNSAEWAPTVYGLRIGFEPTAYYDGKYSSGKSITWYNYGQDTFGDDHELPNTAKNTWPTTGVNGVHYPRLDSGLNISGLKCRGYYDGVRMANVSGVKFKDCTLKGVASALYNANYGDTLNMQIINCTFYSDSNTVTNAAGNGSGRLYFKASAAGDTSRFTGRVFGCTFNGLSAYGGASGAPAVMGFIDGVDFIQNTFIDPNPYQYGWLSDERTVGVTGDFKFLHNKFYTTSTTEVRIIYSAETTTSDGDSLIFIGNMIYAPGTTLHANTLLYRGPYTAARAWFDRNIISSVTNAIYGGSTKTLAALVSDGAAPSGGNWPVHISLTGDSLVFGGRPRSYFHGSSTLWYGLPSYGVSTGTNHASIGPTQYTGDPIMWTGNYPGRETYQDMTPWKALKLINAGVLPAVTAANAGTYYEIPRVYNESDATVVESWFDAWRNWPSTTRAKMQYVFSSTTALIKSADSVYVGPAQLIASLNAGHEVACDSTNSATWFRFTRPYNLTDKLQIMHWLDYMETQTDTTRRKFRFAVEGTDLSWYSPATGTNYPNGMWSVYAAIGAGESASDSTATENWFQLPRERPKAFAQSMQNRIYTRALAIWPEPKRRQVRVRTK